MIQYDPKNRRELQANYISIKTKNIVVSVLYDFADNCMEKEIDKHYRDILEEVEKEHNAKNKR